MFSPNSDGLLDERKTHRTKLGARRFSEFAKHVQRELFNIAIVVAEYPLHVVQFDESNNMDRTNRKQSIEHVSKNRIKQ